MTRWKLWILGLGLWLVPISVTAQTGVKFTVTWQQPADGFGPADSYRITVTANKTVSGTLPVNKSITVLSDSFTIALPAVNDTITFQATIVAVRRGYVSANTVHVWTYVRLGSGFAYLSPWMGFPLDTIWPYTLPGTTTLRTDVINVDTTQPYYGIAIDRVDPTLNRTPFRIWVYNWPHSDPGIPGAMQGAFIVAPSWCPMRTGWDAPMWLLRWAPPDTAQDPNVLGSKKLALAAATQLPIDSIRDATRIALERYLRRDIARGTPWAVGNQMYLECFGTPPP